MCLDDGSWSIFASAASTSQNSTTITQRDVIYVAGYTFGSIDSQPNVGGTEGFLLKYEFTDFSPGKS